MPHIRDKLVEILKKWRAKHDHRVDPKGLKLSRKDALEVVEYSKALRTIETYRNVNKPEDLIGKPLFGATVKKVDAGRTAFSK